MLLTIRGTTCYVPMKFPYFSGNNRRCSLLNEYTLLISYPKMRNNGRCPLIFLLFKGTMEYVPAVMRGVFYNGTSFIVPLTTRGNHHTRGWKESRARRF